MGKRDDPTSQCISSRQVGSDYQAAVLGIYVPDRACPGGTLSGDGLIAVADAFATSQRNRDTPTLPCADMREPGSEGESSRFARNGVTAGVNGVHSAVPSRDADRSRQNSIGGVGYIRPGDCKPLYLIDRRPFGFRERFGDRNKDTLQPGFRFAPETTESRFRL
jgi:hypothetical protein